MKAAIQTAEGNRTPFGAALAMGDQLFVTAANQTKKLHDPTAHAEIMAIRKLGKQIKKTDMSGFTLYSTCEPCPMCMSAIIWAKINTVFFGCPTSEVSEFMEHTFPISKKTTNHYFKKTENIGGVMKAECNSLFKRFS